MSSRAGLLYNMLLTGLSPWSKTCTSSAKATYVKSDTC